MCSDFDQRQLVKMFQLLEAFKKKSIPLSSFVSSMEFLFHAMESVSEDWEELFLNEITALESINAGVPSIVTNDQAENIILEAVENLEKLLKKSLNK